MSQIKTLLQKYGIHPSKRLGQNFLADKSVLKKIIAAAELKPDDVVLEVGPGLGVLTLELAKHVQKVIAIEKDQRMVEIVKDVLIDRNIRNVEIIHGDILKIDIDSLKIDWSLEIGHWKLVANIPYYLTSPLIRKFLESDCPPELLVLMIQKEVAQRICARPRQERGSLASLKLRRSGPKAAPKMTLLSVAVQFYAEPKIISYVSKKSFWPQPKVDSAIVRITPRIHPSVIARSEDPSLRSGQAPQSRAISIGLPRAATVSEKTAAELAMTKNFQDHFFTIVKAGFSQPRKQIINNLSKGLNLSREKTAGILKKAGIKPTQRPGELSVDKWVELVWNIYGKKDIINIK